MAPPEAPRVAGPIDERRATIPCNLCGGDDVTVIGRRSRSGAALRTVACTACGLAWSDPRPHDVRRFYEDQYRVDYKGAFAPKPKHVYRAGQVALSRWQRIRGLLDGPKKVLDVGSGGGEFSYLLKSLGHEVRGIEPNRGYMQYSVGEYGLDVWRGFVDDAPLDDVAYDLITIWHVLEHTERPASVLGRLARALKPGGLLVVEVPSIEAVCQAPSSTFHEAHLYHFNRVSLERMAALAGLRCESSRLSQDGGNLTSVFRRPVTAVAASLEAVDDASPIRCPGNHERIAGIVGAHTTISHWLSLRPIGRSVRRWRAMVGEAIAVRDGVTGRQRLDAMYAAARGGLSNEPVDTASRGWSWSAVAGAYVLAILLDWLLFDGGLPFELHDVGAVGTYLLAQTAVVFVLARRARAAWPSPARQTLPVACLSIPLFLLPVYC